MNGTTNRKAQRIGLFRSVRNKGGRIAMAKLDPISEVQGRPPQSARQACLR